MTYEHSGSKMKSVYSKMMMIATTSKINYFKNHDIDEANTLVGLDLWKVELSSGLNVMSRKYSKACINVSKHKMEMNKKLNLQVEKIPTCTNFDITNQDFLQFKNCEGVALQNEVCKHDGILLMALCAGQQSSFALLKA